MDGIKVIHISDLHISEHLTKGADQQFKVPNRYGHNVSAFLALDNYLKNTEWDLLVITGDVTRIGNPQSFEYVRNWLESELHIGAHSVGLNLTKKENQEYVIIPGNHDRFNGGLRQGSLENYNHEFPVVRSGSLKSFYFGEERVNVHFYDSTDDNNTFAYGNVNESSLIPKDLDGNLNIALLHHHFIQPPKHKRESATELLNSADVSAYFINSGFDGIFFGHTHQGYIGSPSAHALSGVLPDKRRVGRLLKRLLPKYFLRKLDHESLVSYKREAAQNGQLPTLESYFNFLFLRKKGVDVKGPSSFSTIKEFYRSLDSIVNQESVSEEISLLMKKKVLISLAPSACQAEAKWLGFHEITFKRNESGQYEAVWERYQYDGARFKKKEPGEHLS